MNKETIKKITLFINVLATKSLIHIDDYDYMMKILDQQHEKKRACDKMINYGEGNESYHSWNLRNHGKCLCPLFPQEEKADKKELTNQELDIAEVIVNQFRCYHFRPDECSICKITEDFIIFMRSKVEFLKEKNKLSEEKIEECPICSERLKFAECLNYIHSRVDKLEEIEEVVLKYSDTNDCKLVEKSNEHTKAINKLNKTVNKLNNK